MKSLGEMDSTGKILVVLGGAILAGTIISIKNKNSEEAAREPLQTDKNNINIDQTKILEVKFNNPERRSLSGTQKSSSQETNYPPHYYTLSKGAQYRFRKNLKRKG